MPLLFEPPTVRIELSTPGEWVDVKRRITARERSEIAQAAMTLMVLDGKQIPDLQAVYWKGLEVGIVAWSFPEPLTTENIGYLETDDFDIIKARLDELWQPRTEEQAKNSSGRSPAPSKPAGHSPKSSGG